VYFGLIGTKNPTRFRKKQPVGRETLVHAKEKSQVWISLKGSRVKVTIEKNTEVAFEVQDELMVAGVGCGQATFDVQKNKSLFIVDLGKWRVGKLDGVLTVKRDKDVSYASNKSGKALVRKDQLLAKSKDFPTNMTLKVDAALDTFIYIEDKHRQPADFTLKEESKGRGIASVEGAEAFCASPAGQFEQCAWKCFGAKKSDKSCATHKTVKGSTAQCVRFTCAADGLWKLPTFVTGGECQIGDVRVGSCQ